MRDDAGGAAQLEHGGDGVHQHAALHGRGLSVISNYLTISNNIYTNTRFKVGVHLDGDETNPTTSTTEAGLGFNLHYEQIKCS